MAGLPTTIELNFLLLDEPPSDCITIAVSPKASMTYLKEAFLAEYRALGYGEVRLSGLYKIDRPTDDLAPRPEDLRLGGPGMTVEDYWPELDKIDKKLIHVLVHPPGLPKTITLNFHVIGDPPKRYTAVAVSRDTDLTDLRTAFVAKYKAQGNGEARISALYKIDRPADDLAPHPEDLRLGGPGMTVKDYWPELDKIDKKLIHVLVHPPSYCFFNSVRLKFLEGLGDRSPSEAARPTNFRKQQNTDRYILNGRPAIHTGPPIVLYHPVFGRFLWNIRSREPLPAETYIRTAHYFEISQALYRDESARRGGDDDENRHLLGRVLGNLLLKSEEYETGPDGVATTRDGVWCIIMEMENEIGTGMCDPSIQAAQAYTRCWKTLPGFLDRCCCPSILIAIAGPWMCILGAIFLDRPVIQPLTDFLWVGTNPNKPSDIDRIARVFHAISEARRELEGYYANLPGPELGDASGYPYPTHYVDPTGQQVGFKYEKHVNRSSRASDKKETVFSAQTIEDPPKRIVVKFVTSYHSDAHRLLAKEGLAPELLYDGTTHPEDQPGPEHSMIVMGRINGVDLGKYARASVPGCVSVDVKRAIELLHSQDIVFGDLRSPNVMLVKDASGKVTGAKLVDFDWCGKHLEGRYPLSINKTSIIWADGVNPGALLDKAHDTKMLEQLGLS